MTADRMLLGFALIAAPSAAPAATVVVYADPMTMERRAVVVDPKGPDRTFLCFLPPAVSACTEITKRRR